MKTSFLSNEEPIDVSSQAAQVRKLEDALYNACFMLAVCIAALALVGYAWVSFTILRPWLGDGANWIDALFALALLPAGGVVKYRIYAALTKH